MLTLSPEQALALEDFQDQKLSIRKQLREVRHGLDRDIQGLGANLKLINIGYHAGFADGVAWALRWTPKYPTD